jgi:hypothetical protein
MAIGTSCGERKMSMNAMARAAVRRDLARQVGLRGGDDMEAPSVGRSR